MDLKIKAVAKIETSKLLQNMKLNLSMAKKTASF